MDGSAWSLCWSNWFLWAVGTIWVTYQTIFLLWDLLDFVRVHVLSRFEDKKLTQTYGEWAVVTGGSDGIGKGYARELARGGMKIVLVARNKDKLNNVAKEINTEFGVETAIIAADFSLGQVIYKDIAKELEGKDIGILVNNVGYLGCAAPTPFSKYTEKEFWGVININVGNIPAMTSIVLPGMQERGRGAIINLGSMASLSAVPYMAIYSSSKIFVDYFTRAVAEEVRGTGVIVQGVHPGMVDTNMVKGFENLINDGKGMPDLFFPKVTAYCTSALATLGKTEYTHGYWSHSLSAFLMNLIPERTLKKLQVKDGKKMHEASLKNL